MGGRLEASAKGGALCRVSYCAGAPWARPPLRPRPTRPSALRPGPPAPAPSAPRPRRAPALPAPRARRPHRPPFLRHPSHTSATALRRGTRLRSRAAAERARALRQLGAQGAQARAPRHAAGADGGSRPRRPRRNGADQCVCGRSAVGCALGRRLGGCWLEGAAPRRGPPPPPSRRHAMCFTGYKLVDPGADNLTSASAPVPAVHLHRCRVRLLVISLWVEKTRFRSVACMVHASASCGVSCQFIAAFNRQASYLAKEALRMQRGGAAQGTRSTATGPTGTPHAAAAEEQCALACQARASGGGVRTELASGAGMAGRERHACCQTQASK